MTKVPERSMDLLSRVRAIDGLTGKWAVHPCGRTLSGGGCFHAAMLYQSDVYFCKSIEWFVEREVILFTLLALVVVVAAIILYGRQRWKSGTRKMRERLEATRAPIEPRLFNRRELEGLPAPVRCFFRAVMKEGQPLVAAVSVEHVGSIDMGKRAAKWKAFISSQRVITHRPGFDWDGRIAMMPGIAVHVHDAYVGGEGILHAAVAGLATVAKICGKGEVGQGELMRFFAEAAWYPTALLPSQGVQWSGVDERSARATLKDGELTVTLLFRFNDDDLIDTVQAEKRGRMVRDAIVPTPWRGRFWNYAIRDGMCVPLEGEVSWLLPEGERPYWHGRITRVTYEFAR